MTSRTIIVHWPGGDSEHELIIEMCTQGSYIIKVESELLLKPMSVFPDWIEEKAE